MKKANEHSLVATTVIAADPSIPKNCQISAVSYDGLTIRTATGEPAMLAVIDMQGRILDSGPGVARAVWKIALESYRNFLIGSGHLRVLSRPTEPIKA
ncbi:hypothetical protein [Paraburkholderia tuberum]|uniref:Uncharacterized protein n=1 Tax=Paraburkholderia tuberum TaxID=157910 RepID=A0A1H1H479_9BURK|nr:hypothetical protein [Paraburkholderia tuberum]SDR20305.1 hypothetical protein SAMN05445850_3269 [Paraburkholderia tuberum]